MGSANSPRTILIYYQHHAMPKQPRSQPLKKKNPAAVALSKLGASKGGIARARKLSSKERSKIARRAAAARWEKET